jgi:hypothetical protein
MSPAWSVVASPKVLSDCSADEDAGALFAQDVLLPEVVKGDPDLHLAVSIRSHRARMVSQWVKFVLEGNAESAARLIEGNTDFPVALTRDLAQARLWLHEHCGEQNHAGSCGLLASSGALRLRAHGIEVSTGFRHGYPYEDWFLRTAEDTRSSSRLEVAATEFECQGLEVDWAGVCWGDDMVFDAENWTTRRFKGTRWTAVLRPDARKYIINKYRVLLTRARRGLVVWVPPGSQDDATRDSSRLDATALFLTKCGLRLTGPATNSLRSQR